MRDVRIPSPKARLFSSQVSTCPSFLSNAFNTTSHATLFAICQAGSHLHLSTYNSVPIRLFSNRHYLDIPLPIPPPP